MARAPLFRMRPAPMALLALFALLAAVVVRAPASLVSMNEAVMHALVSLRTPASTGFFSAVTWLADPPVLGVSAAIATLVLIGVKRPVDGVFVGGSTALTFGISELFKRIVAYPRPTGGFLTALPTSDAFPSGHAICALVFFGALALVLAVDSRSDRKRIAVYSVAAVLVVLVGVSRMYLGVHWIADVSGSWLLGAAILLTTADTWHRTRSSQEAARTL